MSRWTDEYLVEKAGGWYGNAQFTVRTLTSSPFMSAELVPLLAITPLYAAPSTIEAVYTSHGGASCPGAVCPPARTHRRLPHTPSTWLHPAHRLLSPQLVVVPSQDINMTLASFIAEKGGASLTRLHSK